MMFYIYFLGWEEEGGGSEDSTWSSLPVLTLSAEGLMWGLHQPSSMVIAITYLGTGDVITEQDHRPSNVDFG